MTDPDFPFSSSEWQRVQQATLEVVNATFFDDHVLRDSLFMQLQEILVSLRAKYGEHPILLETEADFCEDRVVQKELYAKSVELSLRRHSPTYTARISFAQLLLDEYDDPLRARTELLVCDAEVQQMADRHDKDRWAELLAICTARCAIRLHFETLKAR